MPEPTAEELVKDYLRGQNLEQVGRVEDAVLLYERAVGHRFDASGPYDRLLTIYGARAAHRDVIRVAESALAHVKTHREKRSWYEQVRDEARRALTNVPRAAPKPR